MTFFENSKKMYVCKLLSLMICMHMIHGLDGLTEIFKLENINLKSINDNKTNYVVWEDTSMSGNNNHVIIKSEYLSINDNINGYCVSSQDIIPIYVPIDISPNKYPNLTIIAWVYQTSKSHGSQSIIDNDNGGWDRALFPYSEGHGGVGAGVGRAYSSEIDYLTLNRWSFISVVYTNIGTAIIYKGENGSLINQDVSYGSTNIAKDHFAINGVPNTQRLPHFFLGCIGQVEIYSDALTHNDIQERFEDMMKDITTPNNTTLISTENILTTIIVNNISFPNISIKTMLLIIISCISVLCIIIFGICIYCSYINISQSHITPKISEDRKNNNISPMIIAKNLPLPLSVKSSNNESELANHIQSIHSKKVSQPSGIKVVHPNIVTPNDPDINRPSIGTDNTEIILAKQTEGVIHFDNEYAL